MQLTLKKKVIILIVALVLVNGVLIGMVLVKKRSSIPGTVTRIESSITPGSSQQPQANTPTPDPNIMNVLLKDATIFYNDGVLSPTEKTARAGELFYWENISRGPAELLIVNPAGEEIKDGFVAAGERFGLRLQDPGVYTFTFGRRGDPFGRVFVE
ncbi:MAG: hypothetical protein N2691_04840 [Patescibacteria group bacterium]|nr:hypothetical protein [Patescibacteria group bacterium]